MAERNTLEKFFTGKNFQIPTYQRDYAWTQSNIDDLLADIDETIETKTSHYIGTVILSRRDGHYKVVDGQQRLTTLTLLLNAVVSRLPEKARIIKRDAFIFDETRQQWRLQLAEYNRDFFIALLEGKMPEPASKSQRLLIEANRYINERIKARLNANAGNLADYLEALQQLEIMEFVEPDEGRAIRIFQTVNDRGRPLSVAEKTKSLLIYYSNRLLSGKLDDRINEAFGVIFRSFSAVKEIGEQLDTRIDLIAASSFDEDSVLRYHFLSFPINEDYYDFKPTTNSVLDSFLKPQLKRVQSDLAELEQFIDTYVQDLKSFFLSLHALIIRVKKEPRYFKLFCFLNLSTHLYPLAVRLQFRRIIEQKVHKDSALTFADLIEIADVRIYKSKSKDPLKDIAYLAREAVLCDPSYIRKKLGQIVRRFMKDSDFTSVLTGGDMYSSAAIVHLLMEYGETRRIDVDGMAYSISDLIAFKRSQPTIDHIFAQQPTFDLPGRGFEALEEYETVNHSLGNLTALERELNSRAQNKTPDQKFLEPSLYKASDFDSTRSLVADVAASGKQFDRKAVEERTRDLANWSLTRWPLWPED